MNTADVCSVTNTPQDKCAPWVRKCNEITLSYLLANNDYEALGPSYSTMSFKEAEANLQLHRLHKNFEAPSDCGAKERKTRSLWAMVDYDFNGITDFEVPLNAKIDPYVRHQLYNIRNKLNEIISDYRLSFSDLEFPSGETYVSADGDISLYAKLRDMSQWTCTVDCFDLFARICYNSPMLKFAARRHFKIWQIAESKKFSDKNMWKAATTRWKFSIAKRAFEIFKAKLRCIVTFVRGARLTTVPKNVEVDRVITCEPFCNMVTQRTIEIAVRKLILKHFDIDLDESQILHKVLILDQSNATIDLKNASNSVFNAVIKWFFGNSRLGRDLQAARSPEVEVEGGMGWKLNMLAPMGNGYTFGIMTLLLLTITREYDSMSHVFGDDIIVCTDVAYDVITLLRNIGFDTNVSKTFTEGNFRESCGGFTAEGRYITSFDLSWAEDEVDAVVNTNKIGLLAYATNSKIRHSLQRLHSSLLEVIPSSLYRTVVYRGNYATRKVISELSLLQHNRRDRYYHDMWRQTPSFDLEDGCYVRRVVKQKSQSDFEKRQTIKFVSGKVNKDLHLGGGQYESFIRLTKKNRTYMTKKGNPLKPVHNINRLFGWYYIWAGKSLAPNLKETYVSQRWVTEVPKILG